MALCQLHQFAFKERFVAQVVVVTGGGAAIGRTYAHRFAAEGARRSGVGAGLVRA